MKKEDILPPGHKQFLLGSRVEVRFEDLQYFGTITEVNDEDQGEFEYYITTEDGNGNGYWDHESIRVISIPKGR